jgi:hypothetical protein
MLTLDHSRNQWWLSMVSLKSAAAVVARASVKQAS